MHPVCQSPAELFDCLPLEKLHWLLWMRWEQTDPSSADCTDFPLEFTQCSTWFKKVFSHGKTIHVIYVGLAAPLFSTSPTAAFRVKLLYIMIWIIFFLVLCFALLISNFQLLNYSEVFMWLFFGYETCSPMRKRNKNKRKLIVCLIWFLWRILNFGMM